MASGRAAGVKVNAGGVLGGGVGVDGKGAGTGNTVWSVFPLPCLPSSTSHQPSGPLKASGDSAGALPPPQTTRGRVDTIRVCTIVRTQP